MRLLLLGSGGLDLGCQLVCFSSHPEKFFGQAIRKFGKRFGDSLCLFAAYRKINDIVVNSVIADKAACMSELRQRGWQIERIDFLRQIVSFGVSRFHHALNANPQHCARRARRQSEDVLRLAKYHLGFFRHALDRRNSLRNRVHQIESLVDDDLPAATANPTVKIHRINEVKNFSDFYVIELINAVCAKRHLMTIGSQILNQRHPVQRVRSPASRARATSSFRNFFEGLSK